MLLINRTKDGWRGRVVLAAYHVLQVCDALIYLGSATLLSSSLAAVWILSDTAERVAPNR